MFNKSKKIILFIFIILLAFSIYHIIDLQKKRFNISTPMEDFEYKKSIILDSKNLNYKLENLRILVGPNELEKFIKENNKNPEIYTPSENNIKSGKYIANLHMHTTNSDGAASVAFLLNQAQNYAQKELNGKSMYLAITDHNTVLGAKELIKIIQENPNKYPNLKVITGIEINTAYKTELAKDNIDIHVLAWCINPYDKFLNKEFYKKDLKDKYNRKLLDRDFDEVINFMSEYSIVGVAHPARYLKKLGNNKNTYISEMFNRYKVANKNNILFTEGYYQSYQTILNDLDKDYKTFLDYINTEAQKLGINLTGSTDVHGYNIFRK